MSVDYSPHNYQESKAAIDAAARLAFSQKENMRVRQFGNQVVVSEHRDPFSFYWQMEEIKPIKRDPPRRVPRADYVLEVEESQYSRLQKAQEVKQLPMIRTEDPSGFSHYWHVDTGVIERERQKTPPPPPSPPTPQREVENQYVQVEFEPEPQIIQQLPPPQPIVEEHVFRQTTTKRMVENEDETKKQIIKEKPKCHFQIATKSPGYRRRILREFRPVAYT